MKLTTLEDNIGCGCSEKLNDQIFAPIPGIDRVPCNRCGKIPCGCGKGANTVTQNPVINVNVGNKSNGGFSLPNLFPNVLPQDGGANNQYVDELIDANKKISELENRKPEIKRVDRPVIVEKPVTKYQKVYRTVPIDRIKTIKETVNKIIPLDRIKTIFKKQDVVIPLQKIKYSTPNVQRSSFEGEYK